MIKIFREIRKQLITKGRIGKYALYASGEILLVVIGILIALGISNWNQNSKNDKQELMIMKSLQKDFKETKVNVENTIQNQSIVVLYCENLMRIMHLNAKDTPMDTLSMLVNLGALSYWRIEPLTGTYDALIGSGNTSLINNDALSSLLAQYSAELKYGFEDEYYSLELTMKLTELCSPYSRFLLSDKNKKRLNIDMNLYALQELEAAEKHLSNHAFLGVLDSKLAMARNRLDYQKNILSMIENILTTLQSEIAMKQ